MRYTELSCFPEPCGRSGHQPSPKHILEAQVLAMSDPTTRGETTRTRTIRELHELIAALDRRVPQVERVGEVAIARAAAALRAEALRRIEELEREATADAGPVDVR